MRKYFNLKQGSQEKFGTAIRVDTDHSSKDRILDLNGNYSFELIYGNNSGIFYNLFEEPYIIPRELGFKDSIKSVGIKLDKGSEEPIARILLDEKGNLTLVEKLTEEDLFISEINQEQAEKNMKDDLNWKLLQAWA